MAELTPLATVADYAARYGQPTDEGRVAALLEDATALLLSAYEQCHGAAYQEGERPAFDRAAKATCCAIVSRALNVPTGFEGATQYTQTAGSYSASVTLSNPTGDLWLSKSDRQRLGLVGYRIGSIAPMTAADRGDDGGWWEC